MNLVAKIVFQMRHMDFINEGLESLFKNRYVTSLVFLESENGLKKFNFLYGKKVFSP